MPQEVVFHGSRFGGNKTLEPRDTGFGKNYVYATDNFTEAVIFLSERRNSLQATWDLDCESPFFCERVKGVFERWYSGIAGSVYVLPRGEFERNERLSSHEFLSSHPVDVTDEILIEDAKEYLEDKLRIVYHKDRRILFPDDSDLISMCLRGLDKYSLEFTIRKLRELQPDLEEVFLAELNKQRTE